MSARKRKATYQDVLDAPEGVNAEIAPSPPLPSSRGTRASEPAAEYEP